MVFSMDSKTTVNSKAIVDMKKIISERESDMYEVILCSSATKEKLEASGKIPSMMLIFDDPYCKDNQLYIVTNKAIKQHFIDMWKATRKEGSE